jgi:hypothetical protein
VKNICYARAHPGPQHPSARRENGSSFHTRFGLIFVSLALAPEADYHLGMRIRVEMKPQGAASWELLGNFSASEAELRELRSVLSRRENPLDALSQLPKRLLWDTLDICRVEGHACGFNSKTDGGITSYRS